MSRTKDAILQWLSEEHTRTVYLASIHFNMDIDLVWSIINEKDK